MNKKALALVLISFSTPSLYAAEIYNKGGNKLDLYGEVEAEHYFSGNSLYDGDQSYMRLGFRGESQISDKATAYGQYQMQVQGNSDEFQGQKVATRYAFAGLRFKEYGSIDYGRNEGVLYDVLSYTDMQPEFDGWDYNADQYMFHRANGVLTYRSDDFFGLVDGLNFALQYQGHNGGAGENNSRGVLQQNGDGYGASLSYDFGNGISVVGAMMHSRRTAEQNSNLPGLMGKGNAAEAYSVAAKYNANNIYLAAMYTQGYNVSPFGTPRSSSTDENVYGFANKSQIAEIYASYAFDMGLSPFIAYNIVHGSHLGKSNTNSKSYGDGDIMKYIDLGVAYYFNKNMDVYVDYLVNLIHDDDFSRDANINTNDITALGFLYTF